MATITSTTTTPPTAVLSEKLSPTKQKNDTPKFSWESGPMQIVSTPISATGATDQYTKVASEMALVHNCIIRAMNSIYIQAPHVPPSEHQNFVNYALATHRGLCMHHDGEEEVFFPTLEKLTGETGLMDANVQGHRDFDEKLGHWGKWLEACQAKKDTFTAAECTRQMDDFMPPLAAHLGDEIPTLLALSRFGDKLDLLQLMKEEGEKIMGSMSKTEVLPLFLLNHYDSFEGGIHVFPPLPGPVSWTLRCVFGRWNSAWWQFSTVGYDGLPRELKYVGEK